MTNHVTHWQLLSTDPDATAAFYADLFGWKVSSANGLGYREIATGGEVDGGIWPAPAGASETVHIYVDVPEIDAVLKRTVELGGSILMPRQILPDGDEMALAMDPLGRPFGVMRRAAPSSAE